MLTPKNWYLTAYTDDTWEDLLIEPATVATFTLANTSADTDVTFSVQLTDNLGAKLATILPPLVIPVSSAEVIDVRSINVLVGQHIQVKANVAGAEFLISGVVDV
ncbi:hypothetical protein AB6E53_02270 [Vibrio breoganii]|uniref:Uncharacterized protein n=1 Tax=Vibrio breoganii TaxID=553239 RepID=A0AAP8SWX9_9VIBR|nr:hypothetical protein [Vibrio breoganii]PMP10212.1 hypothetical protein BCS93_11090 [Vibrio breoganii]